MKRLAFAVCVLLGCWCCLPTPARAQSLPDPAAPSPTPLSAVTAPVSLQRTELYFGGIARASWDDFLATVVTPRFPDGLTWYDAHGQWQTRTGIVTKQDSRVLVLIHAATPEKDRLVEELREQFKTRYHELSVLRADAAVTASF
jgi:hypothetical protein